MKNKYQNNILKLNVYIYYINTLQNYKSKKLYEENCYSVLSKM